MLDIEERKEVREIVADEMNIVIVGLSWLFVGAMCFVALLAIVLF